MPFNLHINTDFDDVDQITCPICGDMTDGQTLTLTHNHKHSYTIIPFLYLGSASNAKNMTELSNLDIHTIVNMTHEAINYHPERYNYINYPWHDHLGFQISEDLDNVCDQIHAH